MIDVTATMLPSTVMNDRSFADQIASSAIIADSRYLFMNADGQKGQERREGRETRTSLGRRPSRPSSPSCLYLVCCCSFVSIFTASPSLSDRTELYGPVMTISPGFRPERSSKYLSPAMPILIGTNSARLLRKTKTPSVSLRVWPGLSSAA